VLRKKYSNVRWNITSRSRKLNSIDEVGHASHTRRALPNTKYRTSGQRMCLMKCQRILTKGRIALATVTLAAGESILKPRFCGNALPLRISPQPRAATGVCCLHSLLHFNGGGTTPQIAPFPSGDTGLHLLHGSLVPPESKTQTASRSVQPFL